MPDETPGQMRVVIYGMNYAPEFTGVGRYTGEIANHLAEEGHEVCVVTAPPHYPGWKVSSPYQARSYTKESNSKTTIYRCPLYLRTPMSGLRRLLAPLSFALSSAPVAFWQIVRRRPQVVITIEPTLFTAPVTLLAARLARAKAVLHVQDLEIDAAFAVGHMKASSWLLKGATTLFDSFVTRGFDQVITISHKMAARLIDKGVPAERIEVVRNWVDLDKIQPASSSIAYRHALDLPQDVFLVLYSGNLGAKQGIQLVIDAARELEGRSDIMFVIAGEGPMRHVVEAASAELSNLRIFGFQPEARFSDFLGIADVHVLPQERDAADLLLPSKLGAMLASGRRIIATADPNTELAEFLGDAAIVTPPGDSKGLADAIVRAHAEPTKREQQEQRLMLARSLAKPPLIAAFTKFALNSAHRKRS